MKNSIRHIWILILAFALTGCSEYQQLLKSRDPDLKYEKALVYFDQGKYTRSQSLLEDVSSYYRGTERAQDVITYLARSYMGMKDYTSAANYYSNYLKNYPKGKYAIEARFQIGHCYYLDAPDARLDQTTTEMGIERFTQFVELYPESPYAHQAYEEMGVLLNRLAYKELLNARLYYNLGTYLGNNYLSAEIVAKNALKNYPGNDYMEEFSWIIFSSKYQQMLQSVEEKKLARAHDADDEYYNFITEYPDSKHNREAERFHKEIQRLLSNKQHISY